MGKDNKKGMDKNILAKGPYPEWKDILLNRRTNTTWKLNLKLLISESQKQKKKNQNNSV